ncbi:MFS transporter [Halobacteriovorax sp. JY17]|uniref:MFS transporter n=1 Tax=Halobacteriovorax sp. JY17 TaxID=2014617 RepID=UPI0025C19DDD|nr:MFS transporter [Halobacteriovorax sp. JY17]
MNWRFIALGYLSLFALSLLDNGRSPTYNAILEDLSIGPAKGSYIFSVASFISLLVNLTAVKWLPKLGPVVSTRISLSLMALSGFFMYITGVQTSYTLLIVSSVLLGLGLAICTITMNVLVIKGSTSSSRKRLFSGLHAIYGLSSLLAPFILAFLIKHGGDWKTYFVVSGIIAFSVILITAKTETLPTEPQEKQRENQNVPVRFRILFGLLLGAYVASEIVISTRLPYYLRTVLKFDEITAGYYLSFFFLSLCAGRLLFSLKSFNFKSEHLMIFSHITTLVCFFSGLYIHPLFLALCGFTMSYAFPMGMDFLVETFKEKSDYMITSVMTWIGVMLASMHFVFGLINENYGANIALLLSPLLSLLALGALIIFLKSDKSSI